MLWWRGGKGWDSEKGGGGVLSTAEGVGKTKYPRKYEQLTLEGVNQPEQGMLHRRGANIHIH